MKDFVTYLSTAPVLTLVSASFIAGLLIEINRFFPDALIFSFLKQLVFLPIPFLYKS